MEEQCLSLVAPGPEMEWAEGQKVPKGRESPGPGQVTTSSESMWSQSPGSWELESIAIPKLPGFPSPPSLANRETLGSVKNIIYG
jgi:hypothetical protein